MSTREAIKSVKSAVNHVDVNAVTDQANDLWSKVKGLPQNVGTEEQKLSVIGGAALGAIALTRLNRVSGWLALGASAALIIRGTTGHCELYSKLGIDTKNK